MKRKAGKELFKLLCAGFFLGASVQASPGAAYFLFSNTNLITLNTWNPLPNTAPYPSSINVAGLAGLVVTRATVTLQGLTHQSPSDVALLLVGPQNQRALLMAEVGGQDARYSNVTNLTLIFDDNATQTLPVFSNLTSGTFKPTDGWLDPYFGDPGGVLPYDFPFPAPLGSSNSVSALSVFQNADPTGTWNLFALDDSSVYSGYISNGWELSLSVAVPLQITQSLTNVVVSWPASVTNCQLQSSPAFLGANTWSNVVTTPVSIADRVYVTNSISGEGALYRLVTN